MSSTTVQFWPRMRRVERAAWSTIVRCVRARKLTSIPLPIPVEAWIEGPLGIRFGVADLSALGPNVLGRALPRDREIEVSHTIAGDEPRFRFTAAHELGHVVMHAKLSDEFREEADRDFYERSIEREADRFAAAFLMPLPAFAATLQEASASASIEPHALLAGLRRGDATLCSAFRDRILPVLCERFGVSRSAAAYRFADIELATGDVAIPSERIASLLTPRQHAEPPRRS